MGQPWDFGTADAFAQSKFMGLAIAGRMIEGERADDRLWARFGPPVMFGFPPLFEE
jgi:hypothetical protein